MKVILVTALLLIEVLSRQAQAQNACPGIVNRQGWGGRPPGDLEYMLRPIHYVIIQHTVSPECSDRESCSKSVRGIQSYHMDNLGWHDIGLSFMVGDNGEIYEGTGWVKVGAHTRGYNKKGISLAFLGTFIDKLPSQAALDAAKSLLSCGLERKILADDYKLYGHLQLSATQSPGQRLYQEIQKWPHWTRDVV